MKNILLRAIISIFIFAVLWWIGDYYVVATNDGYAVAYVGAIIGGGCFWIGSRP